MFVTIQPCGTCGKTIIHDVYELPQFLDHLSKEERTFVGQCEDNHITYWSEKR